MNFGSGKSLDWPCHRAFATRLSSNSNFFAVLHGFHYHLESVAQPTSATPVSPVAVFSDSHHPLFSAFLRFFNSALSPPSRRTRQGDLSVIVARFHVLP